jgi:hypothetical protein
MITWVTPTLAICNRGEMPEVLTSVEAVQGADWIELGNTAYVDSEYTARRVLSILGLSTAEINDRLRFARTGQVA